MKKLGTREQIMIYNGTKYWFMKVVYRDEPGASCNLCILDPARGDCIGVIECIKLVGPYWYVARYEKVNPIYEV